MTNTSEEFFKGTRGNPFSIRGFKGHHTVYVCIQRDLHQEAEIKELHPNQSTFEHLELYQIHKMIRTLTTFTLVGDVGGWNFSNREHRACSVYQSSREDGTSILNFRMTSSREVFRNNLPFYSYTTYTFSMDIELAKKVLAVFEASAQNYKLGSYTIYSEYKAMSETTKDWVRGIFLSRVDGEHPELNRLVSEIRADVESTPTKTFTVAETLESLEALRKLRWFEQKRGMFSVPVEFDRDGDEIPLSELTKLDIDLSYLLAEILNDPELH